MTNEEKANTYAQKHFIREGVISRDSLKKHFKKLLDWKEQQMIEKFTKFLHTECSDSKLLHWKDEVIRQLIKEAMEE